MTTLPVYATASQAGPELVIMLLYERRELLRNSLLLDMNKWKVTPQASGKGIDGLLEMEAFYDLGYLMLHLFGPHTVAVSDDPSLEHLSVAGENDAFIC